MTLTLTSQLIEKQIVELHALYQKEWWTRGRELSEIRRMLEESDLLFAFVEKDTERLAAFARVLTDYVHKALLFDVIVADDWRKTGLGRKIMDTVVQHPLLENVKHLELYCLPELVPFYQKWGFTEELGELRFMRCAAPPRREQAS